METQGDKKDEVPGSSNNLADVLNITENKP